jgi:hypothetical protein
MTKKDLKDQPKRLSKPVKKVDDESPIRYFRARRSSPKQQQSQIDADPSIVQFLSFMSSLEDLHQFVVPEDGRVKFTVRVLRNLQFTAAHPDSRLKLGAAWCRDCRHFVVNSRI